MNRVSDPDLYYYSPWVERPRITWPNNARVAFWVAPNVEFYELMPPQGPGRSAYPRPAPDIGMYTIRDYGNRVGFWRMAAMLDDYKIRASISLNVAVFDHLPEIAKACTERDWELFSHGIYNTRYLYGMSEAQELAVIEDVKATIFRHSGQKLDGWLSPALSNTPQTMELLVRRRQVHPRFVDRRPAAAAQAEVGPPGEPALFAGDQRLDRPQHSRPAAARIHAPDLRPVRPPVPRGRTLGHGDGIADPSVDDRLSASRRTLARGT